MARWIIHADADAFFASVEARDSPSLSGRPFAVAAEVVMCASYAARGRGVRAGMTVRQALRRCPDLVLMPARPAQYQRASESLFALLRRYAEVVEPGSMEEAFLAVTADDPETVGRELRSAARDEVGLPVSVGIGRTKLMAKLASRRAKPDGLVLIDRAAEDALRPTLRLAELWGVGPRTIERLRETGLVTVADLAGLDEAALAPLVGTTMARRLVAIAAGTDDASVRPPAPRRAVSASRTISPPTRTRSTIHAVLCAMVATAVGRMSREGRPARRIEVFARYDDGSTVSNRALLPLDAASIESIALDLLDGTGFEADGRGVSMVGLTLTLSPSPPPAARQLLLPLDHQDN